jgi:UDP-N-acetyl-D-galactosamine dehydrogenase
MKNKIAIVGLGYVGLPLAVEFAKQYEVVGFDINPERVEDLRKGIDATLEIATGNLKNVLVENSQSFSNKNIGFLPSSDVKDIALATIYIVTVPTPIDKHKKPDLSYLISASKMIAAVLKKEDIVIYESTVYPGCTEEDCVPVLEKYSGLKFNKDFFCGYSPERINPGDKINTISTIKKVTSGSNPATAKKVNELYKSIITAGTHLAPSIKVAEAAKVIENSQRDLNISFVNELALIFNRLEIDTNEVLDAAATKWNFLNFRPGLVGGHCISVDPYYLSAKAKEVGYYPEVLLSGRKVNEKIAPFVANRVMHLLSERSCAVSKAKILILGITFKENCPDIRNSKVFDLYKELLLHKVNVDVHDPTADYNEVKDVFNIDMVHIDDFSEYNAIIFAVPHNQFKENAYMSLLNAETIIYDLKNMLDSEFVNERL